MINVLITVLKALEALVLRCPSEITPFLGSIIQVGNQYIKYDPVSSHFSLSKTASYECPFRTMQVTAMMKMKTWPKMTMRTTKISVTSAFSRRASPRKRKC